MEVLDNTNTTSENQNSSLDPKSNDQKLLEVETIDLTENDARSSSSPILTLERKGSNGQKLPENIDSKDGVAQFDMFQCPLCLVKGTEQNFGSLMHAQMHIETHGISIEMQNGLIKNGTFKIPKKTTVIHGYIPGMFNIAYNTQEFRNK